MNFTITLSWWLLPLVLTIVSFAIANNYKPYKGTHFAMPDIEGMIRFGLAIIFSLICWLVWALSN